jgi:hypothetical protein
VSLIWKILRGVAAVLAAVLVAGVLYRTADLSSKRDARAIGPQFSSSIAPDRIPVVARAWLRSDRLVEGETFEINFEIQNNSPDDVTDVAIESLDGVSEMKADEWSVWRNDRWEGVRKPEFQRLPRGATGRFHCNLTAVSTGSYSLAAVYAFTTEKPDGVRFHNAVMVGPLHVTPPGLERFLAYGVPIQTVITALILPLCLVLLAFYLPYRHQQVAQNTAQMQQTWNLLLLQSLEAGQKYYLPVCSAIMRMKRFARSPAVSAAPLDWRKAFYALLLVMRNMRACRDDFGGLHFKNREGEDIAQSWWAAISDLLAEAFPLEVSEAALDHFGTRESYSQFLKRFDDPNTCLAFVKMGDKFKEWCAGTVKGIDAFEKCLPVFLMFAAVLLFEVNRPLRYWYGRLDEYDGLEEALGNVQVAVTAGLQWRDKAGAEGLVSSTKDYVEHVKIQVKEATRN